jgi:toluene monooxygenase system protein B
MSAFPILSRFQQDAHIKTVEIESGQTMDEVAAACAFHSIDLHLAARPHRRESGYPLLRLHRHLFRRALGARAPGME